MSFCSHKVAPAAAFAAAVCALVRPAAAAAGKDALPAAGAISLDVDLSEAPRRIFHARLKLPAREGNIALLYPKWIPGEHGPTGPIKDLAGLRFRAQGKALPWRRDSANMYRFLVDAPVGTRELEVELDAISPPPTVGGFSQGASATARLALLSWNQVVLVPEGASPRDLLVRASLRVPRGWRIGTALQIDGSADEETRFTPVSLERLVDSPVLAGALLREVPIGPTGGAPHFLELAGDGEETLQLDSETKAHLDALVVQAQALFGAHHYGAYRFLVSVSDSVAHFGLEHHESSDDRVPERALIDPQMRIARFARLLPHEFVHSWNGKYRRPAGLATRDYQEPMRGELLWVYEGLTDWLGTVLVARSGLWTQEQARDFLAFAAEVMQSHRGRAWRPLEDTTVAAQILYEARGDWESWRRGVDFYPEGDLIWLEADTLIRESTQGKKSLDDFCRLFHGGASGRPEVRPYTFDDVIAALAQIAPALDWRSRLLRRVQSTAPDAPLDGLGRAGWKLGFAPEQSEWHKGYEKAQKLVDLRASIGLLVDEEKQTVVDVVPGRAADKAGVAPGLKLVAVNGRKYNADRLRDAVGATRSGSRLTLLVENAETIVAHSLDYKEGARYARLEREAERPDLLSEILKPVVAPDAARR